MDRFQEMQIFTRIVDRRSFTQAAEDLNLPRATVTNSIKRLETRLGVRLLERTTRQVKPTPDGDAYYQRCTRLLADLEETEEAFRDTDPHGRLRVNMQGTLAQYFVMPRLPQFLARYPRIELFIGSGDHFVDLVREGIDCVLRAGELSDSSMIARRVALLEQVTVASPAYLERYGDPASIEALLDGHRAVNYLSPATGRAHPLEFARCPTACAISRCRVRWA
ncbi:DNA-binding transcriptional LysR family regulator [Paraburkholderia bannensis]|uniref:DNA-binding transcriptional LysR family regulator n=1 Tax=Paraburkholderia bannensis TaxID=765414 RepID=A0A7W9U377_9BURK|nr:DNA-binding transcriptional LysR family regulator [Paraburkholderia sp. WP4_3_2]MBB6105110.1 DNA-binding transcriptional LysR family regulator [Paraburkholderia bannensis]